MASALLSRAALRRPSVLCTLTTTPSQWARYSSSPRPPRRSGARILALLTIMGASGAGTVWAYSRFSPQPEPAGPAQPEKAEVVYEKPRKTPRSKEESRDIVSSQHLQVKKSWEHPGVYAWGSNAGKVVAPDSDETVVKTPRRIPYFDGQILRDLKLDRDFGAAVTEKGDLVQWGAAFSKDAVAPTVTLKGKDIAKIAVSRDRIIALSSGGSVYSIPVAKSDQALGEKQTNKSSSWFPFWSSGTSATNYRSLTPAELGWGEKVTDVKSGLEHCLLLTSKGRVFSAASSSEAFPARGQLGIPGLTWQTRPAGPYDQLHEVKALAGRNVKAVATGDLHSLALDDQGCVFSFGDNATGQLGRETDVGATSVDTPSPLPISKLYKGTDLVPTVTSIASGGHNSFFTVDATRKPQSQTPNEPGRTVADTWACGAGIHGGLGTGKWTHISAMPTKIKALSGLSEYDETANRIMPIRLAHLAVGSTHACAILDNLTHLTASRNSSSSATDTNFGADALWWGGNEHYQLGTGKRNNTNVPVYIGPLDGGQADAEMGRTGEPHRFQITPRTKVRLGADGKGRTASVEQRVECGRHVTAVYSGA
ncbi:regulator of chromosome condensation 1/beta-lactamase-inhibitor protein II [Chaetomidium leptoderma]|uniref:Regulator of chromosome condensation 1/beta-lactamase-inhibitor protein II n=1 Tax=Chaetomidium leptoderma TaxID=669021 RepID=A0AAN6VQ74_9PEZI|nr:regulator of chromosome condensation 1/beta-lactamase-inhibitor protein II [Chaetomidium leptoderma]